MTPAATATARAPAAATAAAAAAGGLAVGMQPLVPVEVLVLHDAGAVEVVMTVPPVVMVEPPWVIVDAPVVMVTGVGLPHLSSVFVFVTKGFFVFVFVTVARGRLWWWGCSGPESEPSAAVICGDSGPVERAVAAGTLMPRTDVPLQKRTKREAVSQLCMCILTMVVVVRCCCRSCKLLVWELLSCGLLNA